MRLVTFINPEGEKRVGLVMDNSIMDVEKASSGKIPANMLDLLKEQETHLPLLKQLNDSTLAKEAVSYPLGEITLCAPIPNPPSVRDFYAFEQHVKTARERRGLSVVPEWYQIPVFYFTNHHAIIGPNDPVHRPRKTNWLDYELEIACIIGKKGRNIKAEEADSYIFGFTILNDWSARDLQRQEVAVGLGPAKGKDFATSIGPYLVTKDELEVYRVGDRYDLSMTAKVNGKLLSEGNFKDIYYTFGQMIERASEDATLYPGDIIGSGTVGTGCILEIGTEVHRWLEPGDVVELEITGLGTLRTEVKD
ncbi:fumarylacetoacetate hydrolase family protein [Ammoniphilus sp. CFH 90114]|uniref:fumarylacetoacetate hydrolase family protein n=1 Tax=Ammoniphilus sp. CFH 90114 TaxID=2493665 RepID=UPI00100DF145|nr:fumarylacetoacetate hydrolase family protein [Ammoniphilus sp. CFH 90114]RXT08813.1 fumarylacetoacetate hydrolase family protein [Ammoniphilus sp. CFH 90114]